MFGSNNSINFPEKRMYVIIKIFPTKLFSEPNCITLLVVCDLNLKFGSSKSN